MPLKLTGADKLPSRTDTVHVLGINVPRIHSLEDLPMGVRVAAQDLVLYFQAERIGYAEFVLRMFCLATELLPEPDRVKWTWLRQQVLTDEENRALLEGATAVIKPLLESAQKPEPEEGDAKNEPELTGAM